MIFVNKSLIFLTGLVKQTTRPMITAWLMGFVCALPLSFIASLIQVWLNDAKVPLGSIGLISLAMLPYGLKFIWAPFLDRYTLPFMGRRRGWIIFSQLSLALALAGFCLINPNSFDQVALAALLVGFLSATQDAVVDAYRREDLSDIELAQGSAYYLWGYRFGLIIVGGGGLVVAHYLPWDFIFLVIAALLVLAPLMFLFSPEPSLQAPPPATLIEALWEPLIDYFQRNGAVWFLIFILFYKLGDQLAGHLLIVFYQKIGYDKIDIGLISKILGGLATAIGAIGGWQGLKKWGLWPALMVFAIFQCGSTLIFVALSQLPAHNFYLGVAVSVENLAAGMGTAAFMTFMSYLTNKKFTAFQYALLSSLMGVTKAIFAAPTGYLAAFLGWPLFFTFCAAMAFPGIFILFVIKPLLDNLDPKPNVTD